MGKLFFFLTLVVIIKADIEMATKFKVLHKFVECAGKTQSITYETSEFKDANCYDYINYKSWDCIDVSKINGQPMRVIELQGWDQVQLFDSTDCSGESRLMKKGGDGCVPGKGHYEYSQQRYGNSKSTWIPSPYYKCFDLFSSVAGSMFVSRDKTFDDEIDACKPEEKMIGTTTTSSKSNGAWNQTSNTRSQSSETGIIVDDTN